MIFEFEFEVYKLKQKFEFQVYSKVIKLHIANAGRDWGQEEKGTTENEMAGWHHRLDGHGFG